MKKIINISVLTFCLYLLTFSLGLANGDSVKVKLIKKVVKPLKKEVDQGSVTLFPGEIYYATTSGQSKVRVMWGNASFLLDFSNDPRKSDCEIPNVSPKTFRETNDTILYRQFVNGKDSGLYFNHKILTDLEYGANIRLASDSLLLDSIVIRESKAAIRLTLTDFKDKGRIRVILPNYFTFFISPEDILPRYSFDKNTYKFRYINYQNLKTPALIGLDGHKAFKTNNEYELQEELVGGRYDILPGGTYSDQDQFLFVSPEGVEVRGLRWHEVLWGRIVLLAVALIIIVAVAIPIIKRSKSKKTDVGNSIQDNPVKNTPKQTGKGKEVNLITNNIINEIKQLETNILQEQQKVVSTIKSELGRLSNQSENKKEIQKLVGELRGVREENNNLKQDLNSHQNVELERDDLMKKVQAFQQDFYQLSDHEQFSERHVAVFQCLQKIESELSVELNSTGVLSYTELQHAAFQLYAKFKLATNQRTYRKWSRIINNMRKTGLLMDEEILHNIKNELPANQVKLLNKLVFNEFYNKQISALMIFLDELSHLQHFVEPNNLVSEISRKAVEWKREIKREVLKLEIELHDVSLFQRIEGHVNFEIEESEGHTLFPDLKAEYSQIIEIKTYGFNSPYINQKTKVNIQQ